MDKTFYSKLKYSPKISESNIFYGRYSVYRASDVNKQKINLF